MIELNPIAIRHYLDQRNVEQAIVTHCFSSLDSTNRFLKDYPVDEAIHLCCAETQTHGRGRFNRHWHSPFGENIYCSIRWHLPCELSRLSGLSMIVSLAIVAALNDLMIANTIKIKWPNDLIWQDQKLCGNLIEIIPDRQIGSQVIIGIGLNVNSSTKEYTLPDQGWCSLHDITGDYYDRNLIIAALIAQLSQHIELYMNQGLQAFLSTWQKVDYLSGKHINVTHPLSTFSGIANGINEKGQLLIIDHQGKCHSVSSGDATLKNKT